MVKSSATHAFDFLARPVPTGSLPPVCVAYGDDAFLRRLVVRSIRQAVASGDDDDLSISQFDGGQCEWRDVSDGLSTMSLFGGDANLVIVSPADDFVTKYRAQLEDYVGSPNVKSTLVLAVNSFPGNTRLSKMVAASGKPIECRLPFTPGSKKNVDVARVVEWLVNWAQTEHQLKLDTPSAQLMYDLIGDDLGLIDQEIAKLAVTVDDPQAVTLQEIQGVVGGWRMKTAFDLIDAAADGNSGEALRQLDRILQAGEHPLAMFGAVSWSLRRYALALRAIEEMERTGQRVNFDGALQLAGFRNFKMSPTASRTELKAANSRLRQIGRQRAGQIFGWLLETDLQLKGSHSHERRARAALEFLLLNLAKQTAPEK